MKSKYGTALASNEEITICIGIFFDGTGNNAINACNIINASITGLYDIFETDVESILKKYALEEFGVSGIRASSYTGYYTNIHWLSELYTDNHLDGGSILQRNIYVGGVGTDAGKPDNIFGTAFGVYETGVMAKVQNTILLLQNFILDTISSLKKNSSGKFFSIKSLKFDLFGFSRGAAAARHFANLIHSKDPAIIRAIQQGMGDITFNGYPSGEIRFLGVFDTVAAIGTAAFGCGAQGAIIDDINLALREGIAQNVFHIIAANECRINYPLHRVETHWPEITLPGAHSDIGGGYLPITKEDIFLSRPSDETVPYNQSDTATRAYQKALSEIQTMNDSVCMAPLLRTHDVSVKTWSDDKFPRDRYGQMRKRSYAALAMQDRFVRNNFSHVVLRVMLEAAEDAGVIFEPIDKFERELSIPDELVLISEKVLAMGKAIRSGLSSQEFSSDELNIIAKKYIHCSANWNSIIMDSGGLVSGGTFPFELLNFINRPNIQWRRTVYNLD